MNVKKHHFDQNSLSHPSWMRGLKYGRIRQTMTVPARFGRRTAWKISYSKDKGILTEEEFSAIKIQVLSI